MRYLYSILFTLALLLPLPAQADTLAPFASNLFEGNFAKGQEGMRVGPGDRVVLRLWNGVNFDGTLTVASDGTLTLPDDLGAVPVAGLQTEALTEAIKTKLQSRGRGDVQMYIAPLDTRAISVFVTGGVKKPGRYQGLPQDPVLTFLDKAGGIDTTGSYRHIRLMRQGQEVSDIDLYPFARQGTLPLPRLQEGDTLVVAQRGPSVAALGAVRRAARFEFADNAPKGADLISLCEPDPAATHVTLKGSRQGKPYTTYLPINALTDVRLRDGDSLTFVADKTGNTIMIAVQGAVQGMTRFPVKRGAHLQDVLHFIAVSPDRAQLDAVYLKRQSVAARQKKALNDSLRRLEESAMTASSGSTEEAQIRANEAQMISKFVERAKAVEPDGVVILDSPKDNPALEDGDTIVIPEKSDVVIVSGEVMVPQAIVWDKDKDVDDYVRQAGGYGARADKDNVLIARQNGAVNRKGDIRPGDQLMVLPKVETKGMQVVKDVAQVLYQVATSSRMVLGMPLIP